MIYKLIIAYDSKRGIGKNNTLPWYLPQDLKRFSELTRGEGNNALIMGRKTWESLPNYPKPLPKRDNLILSNTLNFTLNSAKNSLAKTFNNISELESFCDEQKYDCVWIIGGSQIFDLFIESNKIEEIYATQIIKNYNCDVFFNHYLLWWPIKECTSFTTNDGILVINTTHNKIKNER